MQFCDNYGKFLRKVFFRECDEKQCGNRQKDSKPGLYIAGELTTNVVGRLGNNFVSWLHTIA